MISGLNAIKVERGFKIYIQDAGKPDMMIYD
jgi:hypothetical protein